MLTLVLALSLAVPAFGVGQGKAEFIGGTISGFKEKTEAPIDLKDDVGLKYAAGKLTIPWASIQEVEYGQKVGHRIGQAILLTPLVLFKKSRHHYVTVNYKDAGEKDQAVVFEFDKDDIRLALASFRARTGKEVTFTDEEARRQFGSTTSRKESPTGVSTTAPPAKSPPGDARDSGPDTASNSAPQSGRVRVMTDPVGSDVYSGDLRVGTTTPEGLLLELPTGIVTLSVRKTGYSAVERTLTVGVNSEVILPIALHPSPQQ